jgi:hypothetical protein
MRALAEFSDYEGMVEAIRARVRELEIAGEAFDDYAGLPTGYLSKLIGIKPVRRISHVSMGPLFDALGVYCVMIEKPEGTERIKKRLRPRNQSFVRSGLRIVLTSRLLKRNGRKGGQARWQAIEKKLTPAQRSRVMRVLAQRRWRNQP